MKSKLVSFIVVTAIGLSSFFSTVFADGGITVFLNGRKITSGESLRIQNSAYDPMRRIFEAFGFDFELNGDKKRIKVKKAEENYIMILQAGSTSVNICGSDTTIDKAPVIVNNRVLLPLRAVSEKIGADIDWNFANKTINITKDETPVVTQTSKKFNFQNYADNNFWSDSTWEKSLESENNYKNSADIFMENNKPSYEEYEEYYENDYDDGYDDGYGDGYFDALRRKYRHRHYGHHYDENNDLENQEDETQNFDNYEKNNSSVRQPMSGDADEGVE